MPDTSSTPEPARLIGSRTLFALGAGLLFALGLQALLTRIDRVRTPAIEAFTEDTAVGDRVYYPLPSPLPNPPAVVAKIHGEALVPVSYEKFDRRDSKMHPVARDPVSKLTIYETREPVPGAGDEKLYFVKTASHEYLKLRAAK